MTWLDILLILAGVAVAALATERRWTGALLSLGGLLLLRPLLLLISFSPLVAIVASLLVGLGLALLATRLTGRSARNLAGTLAGGVTGTLFAVMLVLAVATAFPIERTADGLVYPPRTLPEPLQTAVRGSPIVGYGRSILLQPLLVGQAQTEPAVTGAMGTVTGWLHGYLVVGTPWQQQ